MKTPLLFLLAAIAIAGAAELGFKSMPQPDGHVVDRFKIIPLQLTITSETGITIQDNSAMLLDTMTGETWHYTMMNIAGKSRHGWIHETIEQAPKETD